MLAALGVQLAARPGAGDAAMEDAAGRGARLVFDDPEPWHEPVDGATLLDAVAAFVAQRVALPPHAADVCALWLAHTYVFDVWPVTPYLLLSSPARACGKSTLLGVLAALARRSLAAMDCSPAALYRVVERFKPTVFLDEADSWLTTKREDGIVNLLNAGARVGGQAIRCVGESTAYDVAAFDVFCPKLLSGIAVPLPDATRSRCVVLRMERADAAQLAALLPFSEHDRPSAAPLAAQLVRWTTDTRDAGALAARPALPAGIVGRDADLWIPLVTLADAAGARWPAAARAAALAFMQAGARDEPRDVGELALRDVCAYCAANPAADGELVPSAELVQSLNGDPLKPWPTLGRQGLTAKKLADYLRRFGVHAEQRRIDGANVRGYPRAALHAAGERYGYSPSDALASAEDQPAPPYHVGHAGQPGQVGPSHGGRVPLVPVVPRVPYERDAQTVIPRPAARPEVLARFHSSAG
ncbi:Protein of unknown function DUF3631 [Gemmatirosa kalamazoonensis]|uniref:DUF3631 domain-containing protein n=1 Tax=Gemmatirosa kalamazoonensis TaxID=861299 RepID=W0RNF7_9BACT|nr:DUF3631 domain-containing protein [Gemmatirosa kalamazoonensis]AHG91860.1 Protein of unknown function DUF3631 [Gemmatirosa kalamazoonensis]